MKNRRKILLLLAIALAGCRREAGPPAEVVKKAAESLFQRASRGEAIPGIHFTGQGTATPKLVSSEIAAQRRVADQGSTGFEYDVRLSYMNRIQQMEWGTVTLHFHRREGTWEVAFPVPGH